MKEKVLNSKIQLMNDIGLTKEKIKDLELKIDISRWECFRNPQLIFYGQLMMHLKDQLSEEISTACTNGKCIKWNPNFLEKLTQQEVLYVLIHEVEHCALGHFWRFNFLDKKVAMKANQACDHVINLRLNSLTDIRIQMPKDGLADPKYIGLCEEEVYHLLPDGEEEYYGIGDFEGQPQDKKESLKDSWTRKVIQAAQSCKGTKRGVMPDEIKRMLDQTMSKKISWRDEMVSFTKSCINTKNDYTRSSRRNSWQPIVYPRKKINQISKVIWVRDTSGSVSTPILSSFNSLISQCISETGCFGWIFDSDTIVHKIYEVNSLSDIPDTAVGYGGSCFKEAFIKAREMKENGEDISGLIFLSDLFGDYPEPQDYPDFPVLWLSTSKNQVAPFGKTVFVDIDC